MRLIPIIILVGAAVCGSAGAETKTTTRTVVEAGLHYDDNILLPDSVTGHASLKEEAYARHRWYTQLSPARMLMTGLHVWSERICDFPHENIINAGGEAEYRNFLSSRTMVAVTGHFHYQGSPSEYYHSNHITGELLAGHYVSPSLYCQASYEGGLKRFPDYYHVDLLQRFRQTYRSYDHLHQAVLVSMRLVPAARWTLQAEYAFRANDYYDDRHDLDYLDSALSIDALADPPPIDYTAFRAETTWTEPGSMTVYTDTSWYFGAYNVRQKDLYHRCRIGTAYKRGKAFSLQAGAAMRLYGSTDPYYRYRGGDMDCEVRYRNEWITGKLYYQFLYKAYPDRYTDWTMAEQQRDAVHFLRLGAVRQLTERISAELRYTFNQVVSNNHRDAYRKNVTAFYVSYKK